VSQHKLIGLLVTPNKTQYKHPVKCVEPHLEARSVPFMNYNTYSRCPKKRKYFYAISLKNKLDF